MTDRTEAEIRNAALEEAAAVVGTVPVFNARFASGRLMVRPESRSAAAAIAEAIEAIRALKSAPAAEADPINVMLDGKPLDGEFAKVMADKFDEICIRPAAEDSAKGAGDVTLPPLVGTLAALPPHVQNVVVAYGKACFAYGRKSNG